MHDADMSMGLSKLTGLVFTSWFYTVLSVWTVCNCFRNRRYFSKAASQNNIIALQ